MARRGVDRLGVPRGRSIAAAIIRRAEMRAALQDLARNLDRRLARIVAGVLAPAARVLRDAAGLFGVGLMPRGVPIGGPLPDIADHVVEPVPVGRKGPDRRGALVAVGG